MHLTTRQDALAAYIQATNTHDFINVARVLAPEAVFWFGDASCETRAAVHAYFENAWRLIEDEVYAAIDVRWMAVGPRAAACIYTYRYEGRRAGTFVSGSGRATNVFALGARDEWRLVHEHLSSHPSTRTP